MKFKKLIIALFAIAPMIIGGCSRKPASSSEKEPTSSQEPGHVHSFDEFGICSCGEIQEKEGIEFLTAGDESQHYNVGPQKKILFKLKGYKNHAIKFGIAYYFNAETTKLKWVEKKEVKTKDLGSGDFMCPQTGMYYVSMETDADATESTGAYVKYSYTLDSDHNSNEFGLCECGRSDGYTSMNIDALTPQFDSEVGTIHKFKYQFYKDHKYVAAGVTSFPANDVDVYYFQKNPGQWVKESFDKKGLDVFNNGAFYVAPQTGDYCLVVKATKVTTHAAFKLQIDANSHQYEEWGECPCGQFIGQTINTSEDGSQKYAVGDLAKGEKRYFRWKVTNNVYNQMYIGGDSIAVRHTIGLFDSRGVKLSTSGYNQTITSPNLVINKYYYLIVTNPDTINASATIWIRARQA